MFSRAACDGAGNPHSVKGSLAAVEYGVAQLYFDPEGDGFEANGAVPGQLLVGSDVPDDGTSDATPNPFGFPDAKAIDLTDPATLLTLTGAPGRFTVTNTSGGPAAAIFDVTVRFNDLSASATDVEE